MNHINDLVWLMVKILVEIKLTDSNNKNNEPLLMFLPVTYFYLISWDGQ